MSIVLRPTEDSDVPSLAKLRALEWETESYWIPRLSAYLSGEHSPRQALPYRTSFVATHDGQVVGFVAGHLTRRYACDAELEWINVLPSWRHQGIAGLLLATMAGWFLAQNARRVCVDVTPNNAVARAFYTKHGAVRLNPHWMVWHDIASVANR